MCIMYKCVWIFSVHCVAYEKNQGQPQKAVPETVFRQYFTYFTTELPANAAPAGKNTRRPDDGIPPKGTTDRLLIVKNVCPAEEQLAFLGIALDGLGGGDDRHPVVDILACGVALEAVELEILLRQLLFAAEHEQQIGSRRICRTVALCGVRPVEDIGRAVGRDDDVGGVEVAVADLVVLLHARQTGVQLIAGGGVQISLTDLVLHLVLDALEQRAFLAEDLQLDVNEEVHILVELVGILVHQLLEGLSLDIVGDDRPLAVDLGDFLNLGDVQPRLLHARLIERLVEHVGLREGFVEYLRHQIAVAVDFFVRSFCYHMIEFHKEAPFVSFSGVSRNRSL